MSKNVKKEQRTMEEQLKELFDTKAQKEKK